MKSFRLFHIWVAVTIVACNPCKHFYTYKANTVDIQGISGKLKKEGVPFELEGELKPITIKPEYVVATEKLQNLDLLQFSLCGQLKNLPKGDPQRSKLVGDIVATYQEMIKIAMTPEPQSTVSNGTVTTDPCPNPQPCNFGTIDNANQPYNCSGTIRIDGKIDGKSTVTIRSECGDVFIKDKIDGASQVTIEAPRGSVTIGWVIDGKSNVTIRCLKDIVINDKIDGESYVDLNTSGNIEIKGKVGNPNTTVRYHNPGKNFSVGGERQGKVYSY
jgi:hypothetical protein